jgi:hypothetical protein
MFTNADHVKGFLNAEAFHLETPVGPSSGLMVK